MNGNLNSDSYISILKETVLPFMNKETDIQYFQQDNAPIHVSRKTKKWLEDNKISCINWPPLSPDLNPIENLWGIMVRRIYCGNKQYNSKIELKRAIVRAWDSIETKTLETLVESMSRRIYSVIEKRGGATKY